MNLDISNLQQFDIIELYSDLLSGYWFIKPDLLISSQSSKQINVDDIKNVYRMSDKKLCLNYFVNRTNVLKKHAHLLDLVWSRYGIILVQRKLVSINTAGFVEIEGKLTDVRAAELKTRIVELPIKYSLPGYFDLLSEEDKNKLLALNQDQEI